MFIGDVGTMMLGIAICDILLAMLTHLNISKWHAIMQFALFNLHNCNKCCIFASDLEEEKDDGYT